MLLDILDESSDETATGEGKKVGGKKKDRSNDLITDRYKRCMQNDDDKR